MGKTFFGYVTALILKKYLSMIVLLGGELKEPLKNPNMSKFSNPSQTLDLISSNSYLNGTVFGFLKILPIRSYFALKVEVLTIIGLLVIATSKNQMFAPKR